MRELLTSIITGAGNDANHRPCRGKNNNNVAASWAVLSRPAGERYIGVVMTAVGSLNIVARAMSIWSSARPALRKKLRRARSVIMALYHMPLVSMRRHRRMANMPKAVKYRPRLRDPRCRLMIVLPIMTVG